MKACPYVHKKGLLSRNLLDQTKSLRRGDGFLLGLSVGCLIFFSWSSLLRLSWCLRIGCRSGFVLLHILIGVRLFLFLIRALCSALINPGRDFIYSPIPLQHTAFDFIGRLEN